MNYSDSDFLEREDALITYIKEEYTQKSDVLDFVLERIEAAEEKITECENDLTCHRLLDTIGYLRAYREILAKIESKI